MPRFDLFYLPDYLFVGVQFFRGCLFTWEFCDIIELYGRMPRTKTTAQMLAELDALYALGYRGHVDFVDDNLIGNKTAVKAFRPYLIEWQRAHGHPFHFSTEASLNLTDDPALLDLMALAGFYLVFVGIERPPRSRRASGSIPALRSPGRRKTGHRRCARRSEARSSRRPAELCS